MVIDTSVLVEIALGNTGYEKYLQAITAAPVRFMSAVTLYETAIVLYTKRRDHDVIAGLYELLKTLKIEIVPFDITEATSAVVAYAAFGKGIHPAKLNFGDCPAYTLAKSKNLPLLFTGDDFVQTDVDVAAVRS
jgi:ribonuclease VapC